MILEELISGLEGVVAQTGPRRAEIARVVEDSRQVAAGDLFVARPGTKLQGGQFIADALRRGAAAVVAEQPLELPAGAAFVQVTSAARALGYLAQRRHGDPATDMTLLAVTGTKGKTTVAYLIRSILKAAGHPCGLIGTVEIDDGQHVQPSLMTTPGPVELAEWLAKMRAHGLRHCVMEVSSHALHQQRVAGVNFAVGIFTNLTGDHLDYHGTMEEYAAAKALLFAGLSADATAVVNADDLWVERMIQDTPARVVKITQRPPGSRTDEAAAGTAPDGWTATVEHATSRGTRLRLRTPDGQTALCASPLVGRHNVYNTLCAAAACFAAGAKLPEIVAGLENMTGVPGRLERVSTADAAFQVFVDYAHTHDSLENVLLALRQTMDQNRRLICVFGCGGDRDRTKRPKMGAVAERLADQVIVTSDNPRTEEPGRIIHEIMAGISAPALKRVQVEPDRRRAIALGIHAATAGDVVLIAGKGHEDYQIIGTAKQHFDDREEAAHMLNSVTPRPA